MFRMQPSVDCMKQFCRRPVTPLEMTDGVMCAFTGHTVQITATTTKCCQSRTYYVVIVTS